MRQLIKSFFIIILTLGFFKAYSSDTAPKGKIKGTVIDEQSKKPLEYATVALYRAKDDKLITGTITDYLGQFKIDQPNDGGDYYLVITFVGLKDQKSSIFKLDNSQHNLNLGNFFLKSASKDLGEVEVVGKRAPIEYKIDKKVINVDKQITSSAGTAVDVLENVPSVQVDVEGNVSLRGSTGFTVLIDGKPTILDPSDALRQIPSSSIENIEIITNPSVKYEPDGATGIINIITKKNYLDGLSGIVNLDAGMYGQYGADFQVSYRANKFNFILGANYHKHARPGSEESERYSVSNDTAYYLNSNGDAGREHTSKSIRAGIEYNPTKRDFLSLAGRIGTWDMLHDATLRYDTYTDPATYVDAYNSFDKTTRGGGYNSIDGVYQHDFTNNDTLRPGSKKGPGNGEPKRLHNIKLEVNYRYHNSDENSTNELRTLSDSITGGKRNVEKGPSKRVRINLDYSLPIGKKDKFESGFQARFGKSTDITELYNLDTENQDWIIDEAFSNKTNYNRNIYALYALYAGMIGDFGYQAGLRGEYTDRLISTTGEDDFKLNRWDYFPTLHLSYNLPLDQQLMVSYSRRIDRPRGWYLEPFLTWEDEYNVRRGNPDLKPEYIDSYDLGYLIKFKDNFFSLEGYYRVTHNKVERVTSVYSENVMLHTLENVGQDYSLGFEAMLNIALFKWWEMDISGNLFNYRLKGSLYDESFNRTSLNWNSRLSNTFTLWKNGQLQINSRYNSASVTAQGTSSDYYTVDAAFKVNFFDRSLSANLQARDILGTSKREYTSEGQDFNTYNLYRPKTPVLMLTISYRFNNFKPSKRGADQNGTDQDEEF